MIEEIVNSDKSISYRVLIRKKDINVSRTFDNEQDARLFEYYKERLIDNMNNFHVPMNEQITLEQIFELKIKSLIDEDRRTIHGFKNSCARLTSFFDKTIFFNQITFEMWIKCAQSLYNSDVFKGGKTETGKRKMSAKTLRNIFAYTSSAISFVQEKGLNIENNALKVIQSYITPLTKNKKP